jgi:hypothetical protein
MLNKDITKDLYKCLNNTLIRFKETIDAHKNYEPSETEKTIDNKIDELIMLLERED